ncbi:response regulator transcription factor [Smaragdicoccus niigatensis]|uniref:response regulator transcription factor n=1 Tax=Smaragdicoccus niigatensis TaxID=359359 RepID=UPI00036E94FB|nr:response regulator transcription factor [Smaragdicoccus niigatensis]
MSLGAVPGNVAVRVLLVDDQELVRSGLKRILRRKDGFDIVGECADGSEVGAAVAAVEPDVVVMDLRMRNVSGVEATRQLQANPHHPPVLVLTTFDDDETLSAALRAGAAGFVLKDSPAEDLIRAVKTIADGGAYVDPGVTGRVLAAYREFVAAPNRNGSAVDVLTAREQEVLRLIARGRTNAEISDELYISEVTVKSHIGRIFLKLELRDRAAAIIYAFNHGLVRPGESR